MVMLLAVTVPVLVVAFYLDHRLDAVEHQIHEEIEHVEKEVQNTEDQYLKELRAVRSSLEDLKRSVQKLSEGNADEARNN
jgi:hypothetical protein